MTPKCYTVEQLLGPDLLNMPRSTFYTLKAAGKLFYLEEIRPRSGRRLRFRADLVDRYLANQWQQQPRAIPAHRRTA